MNNTCEIFAHRGSSIDHPENTMAAFQAAYEIGADGIEFDVQLTKDLVPVVIHDETLDRTTTGYGLVSDHTKEQLKTLDAGTWFDTQYADESIPTLEEVLVWASDKFIKLNIELKGHVNQRESLIQKVIPMIQTYQLERHVILSSFDHVCIKEVKKLAPEMEAAAIVTAALHEPLTYLRSLGVEGYHYMSPLLLKEEAGVLIDAGVHIRPYTVNEEDMLRRYIQWGCAGIFTDHPKLALTIRDEK
ncbi:glycerophosphodiester phosphodiesterase [Alkalihalophilus pseudofirmus]|uniref:glycerophosphodiester phosphodiesterase n=1 Tax=Alkalihalophilus pseudofirmus TaxID=79885 RepID=UPI00259B7853|nr:glycerophosphodiester phosphodiesterase [Alkalihalophilus pseudofirmus]WEG15392.1 glycerophosphodiester phosphodiesterase [Alkalihalophilus pseudofirmus]